MKNSVPYLIDLLTIPVECKEGDLVREVVSCLERGFEG